METTVVSFSMHLLSSSVQMFRRYTVDLVERPRAHLRLEVFHRDFPLKLGRHGSASSLTGVVDHSHELLIENLVALQRRKLVAASVLIHDLSLAVGC